jgi:hypothetical protein
MHGVSVFCVSTKVYYNPCEMENKICGGQASMVKCSIQASTGKMFKKLFEEFKVAQVKTTGPIGYKRWGLKYYHGLQNIQWGGKLL